jgi:8-oxo-dGTP diphosphatase
MMEKEKLLHVAVGVIRDEQGNVLISRRHELVHQGGLWEFPGGKVESEESAECALARELKEELDISIGEINPLIKIKHQYPDLAVLLDVWTVAGYTGEPKGYEGQEIQWVCSDKLHEYAFPEANRPIITAASLPSEYAILNGSEELALLRDLKIILANGVTLIQARLKSMPANTVIRFFKLAIPLCEEKGASLFVNSAVRYAERVNAHGIHLTSRDLLALNNRPNGYRWVSASCHNLVELQQAVQKNIDFVVLAPVLFTKTHPDAEPLGWERFKELTNRVNLPVFALGGLKKEDKRIAQQLGAQGISGITAFLV